MMFDFADTDGDGQLSFGEFLKVINPPKPDKEGTVEGKVVKMVKEADIQRKTRKHWDTALARMSKKKGAE